MSQDVVKPFDPTGYSEISGVALAQLIDGIIPASDRGMHIITSDVATVPTVPDAVTDTKLQRYGWIRVSATSVSIYYWNVNGAVDATYLKWVSAFQVAIPAASIQGYQIAPNTITDANISDVDYSKISGAPTSLPPSGAAGGDLTGTYPNPSILNGAVVSAKIATNAVRGGAANELATGATGATLGDNIAMTAASTLGSPAGGSAGAPAANDRVVVAVAAAGYVTVRKVIDGLAEPAGGDALKLVQVNAGGTGYQHTAPSGANGIGDVLQTVCKAVTGGAASTTVIPVDNTIPQNTEGVEFLSQAFTPKSAASLLIFEFESFCDTSGGADNTSIALFSDASANALCARIVTNTDLVRHIGLRFVVVSGSTAARTFSLRFGPDSAAGAGTSYLNRSASGNFFSNAGICFLKITEVVGTVA